MANETTILGVIEVYDKSQYDLLISVFSDNLFENVFNIVLHVNHLNNRGSILIPFAKCFRSELDDEKFIDEEVSNIITKISFIDSFSVEIIIDSFFLKKRRHLYVIDAGKISIEKFLISYIPVDK